jgi:hypothetical protein
MKVSRLGRAFAALVMTVVAMSGVVIAHHSPAAFDRTKEVKLTGTVRAFKWQNPHTYIEIDAKNAKGVVEMWVVELTSPTYLVAAGWKNNIIKKGDQVTVVGNPVRDPAVKAAIFISMTLPDGRTLHERPARLGGNAK